MPTDEGSFGTGKRLKIQAKEVSNMIVNTWSMEATAIDLHKLLPLGTHLEGGHQEMRIAELGLDRHRACAEAYIPEATTSLKLEQTQAHQAHWHLRDHIHTTIEGEEIQLLQANRGIVCRGLWIFNDQAVGVTELSSDDFM